jgi:hypothetical protein
LIFRLFFQHFSAELQRLPIFSRTFRSTNNKEPGELNAPSSNLKTAFKLIKDIQKLYKTRCRFYETLISAFKFLDIFSGSSG